MQHRGPQAHRGLLELLLQEHVERRVSEPGDKTPIERSQVYVAPADYHLLVENGRFALSLEGHVNYARPSIDVCFQSVADEYAERAIGIVLTGANVDGAAGLAAIKAARRRRDRPGSRDGRPRHDARGGHRRHVRGRGAPDRGDRAVPLRALRAGGAVNDARAKILLVDDRDENLLALAAILEPLGQELVQARSGEEALRRLLQDDYALILLDVQMPGLDGFQTAALIKQRERTRHVPIIFLTAISKEAEHVFRGYEAGAVDYLMKPLDAHVLRAKVSVFIDLWQAREEARRSEELLRVRELAAERRESEERYRSLAEALPQIVWTTDAEGKTTYFNERWYEFTGRPRDSALEASGVIHPEDLGRAIARWEEARDSGGIFEIEYRFRRADGVYRWQLARAMPIHDDAGAITGWVGTATDIEDRRRMEERERFLAEAGWVLGSSLDYEQTLADVARLAVPRVADWCAVDIFVNGKLERVALEHVDPLKLALARELEGAMLAAAEAAGAAAIHSREPVLVREVDDAALADVRVRRASAGDRARARAALVRDGAADRPR